MNVHNIGLILYITNFALYLIEFFFLVILRPMKLKKNDYSLERWTVYSNGNFKGHMYILPSLTLGLFLPTAIDNPYVNIAFLSLCLIPIIPIRIFMWRSEKCIIIDTVKVTVKHTNKTKKDKVYLISDFVSYSDKTKDSETKILFNGNREIDLGFLKIEDAIRVSRCVKTVYEEGQLPDYYANQKALKVLAVSIRQLDEERKSGGNAHSAPDMSEAEYQKHLEEVFDSIPSDKMEYFIELVKDNRKLEAIHECRVFTGEGLRVAKDLIEMLS